MSFDLFAPITPIAECLKTAFPELDPANIGPSSLLTGTLEEITLRVPGLFIRSGSSTATSKTNMPAAFKDEETYDIIVAVPHGKEAIAPELAAGPLAGKVIETLIGFAPTAQFQPMHFKGFGDHSINVGWAEFPLRFTTQLTYSKT